MNDIWKMEGLTRFNDNPDDTNCICSYCKKEIMFSAIHLLDGTEGIELRFHIECFYKITRGIRSGDVQMDHECDKCKVKVKKEFSITYATWFWTCPNCSATWWPKEPVLDPSKLL